MSDTETTKPESGANDSAAVDDREDVLIVDGLTKIYPDGTLAVDDIDFSIKEGDFCVIIGPSGCGKSTTLHSLVGKIPPTEGKVTLGGTDITHEPTYHRDIGLVFQDFQLFPHLNVEENITYGLKRMNAPQDVVDERLSNVLEMMQLDELRKRAPRELSAGQKQRVALARSLVLEPKLLLLDEPLGDMDYKLQKRMERELLRIHRELGTTFVYVTHDQTQAMRLADQIIEQDLVGGRAGVLAGLDAGLDGDRDPPAVGPARRAGRTLSLCLPGHRDGLRGGRADAHRRHRPGRVRGPADDPSRSCSPSATCWPTPPPSPLSTARSA